jgi:hypothetical protein
VVRCARVGIGETWSNEGPPLILAAVETAVNEKYASNFINDFQMCTPFLHCPF